MSAARPVVRFLLPGDEPALLVHLQATFDGWPLVDGAVPAIDHLRWKLGHVPSVSECSVIAEAGGGIFGSMIFIGQRVRTRGGEWLAAHGADWSVQPAFQGLGLMVAMRLHAAERLAMQADFNPGQTGHARILRLHHRLGYKQIGNALHRFVLNPVGEVAPVKRTHSVKGASGFDKRVDRLWARAAQSFDYIGVRDRHWLNRRYCDQRGGNFVLRLVEEQNELLGYSVIRASGPRGAGYIADLLALPERTDAVESLVEDALTAFCRDGLATAECWLPERHPYGVMIEAAGFTPRSRPVDTIYKALRAPEEAFAFLEDRNAAIHVMIGDSDVV